MSTAVSQIASYTSWTPCCSPSSSAQTRGGLKDRCCPHWRMVPGVITLASSVTAAAYCITGGAAHLLFFFAPSSVASSYLIYLAWDFKNLKTFSENNDRLRESVEEFERENQQLHANVQDMKDKLGVFEGENVKLQESNRTLSEVSGNLQKENATLTDSNDKLQKLVDSLEQKLGTHTENLAKLTESLSGINDSAKENHQVFTEKLGVLDESINKIKETSEHFVEQTETVVEQKMKALVEAELQAAEKLQEAFASINKWKDAEEIKKRIEDQEHIQQKIVAATEELGKALGRMEAVKEQTEELRRQVEENKKNVEENKRNLNELTSIKDELMELYKNLAAETVKRGKIDGNLEHVYDKLSNLLNVVDKASGIAIANAGKG